MQTHEKINVYPQKTTIKAWKMNLPKESFQNFVVFSALNVNY